MKLIECKDAQGSNSNMTLSTGCFTVKFCYKDFNLVPLVFSHGEPH